MILYPTEERHRRITQIYWDNSIQKINWRTAPLYWPWGHIPSWRHHLWVDFTSKENKYGKVIAIPIRAWVDGRVVFSRSAGKWNVAQITWSKYFIEYIHLSKFEGINRTVKAWDIIWYTGNTWTFTTAAHLHMWVRKVIGWIPFKWDIDNGWIDFTSLLTDTLTKTKQELRSEYNVPDRIHWVKVNISLVPKKDSTRATATYFSDFNVIVVYPNWFTLDKIKRDAILRHELGHKVLRKDFSAQILRLWKLTSEWDPRLIRLVNEKLGTNYSENAWVSSYARTNYSEDFSETLEESYIKKMKWDKSKYNSFADFKILLAEALMDKYTKNI